MIIASVVEDSVHPLAVQDQQPGMRLTTMMLTYPRFVHSEFMTHRMFSRNASSSRAIPLKAMRRAVLDEMAQPVAWGANNPGMQSKALLPPWQKAAAKAVWLAAGYAACAAHWLMEKTGVHKQIANRIIEPWQHITVLVTGTDQAFSNFFALRDHPDADPTLAALANGMRRAYELSNPTRLTANGWHLPLLTQAERAAQEPGWLKQAIRTSVARCARVSYTQSRKPTTAQDDDALYRRLIDATPMHASPAEHQAQPTVTMGGGGSQGGNFGRYWIQYRKTLPNEAVLDALSRLPTVQA